MRVLWHLSHHSAARPDGWSGAPDEARWVREDLTPRVVAACARYGIELVLVDGDGSPTSSGDHPEFHADYDAFCAPHYDADTYQGAGGWFWGRADLSTTAGQDDRLGQIFARHYAALPGVPAYHPERLNANVTDYYGFRLTSYTTPGFLVEHGVGAPGAHDHDWLRAMVDHIAEVWASTLAEFGGIVTTTAGDQMRPYYTLARALYPMYASQPFIEPDFQYNPPPADTPDAITYDVDAAHQLHLACRFDYPSAAGDPAWRALEMQNTFDHEIGGHGFKKYLYHYAPTVNWDELMWSQVRHFPGTYAQAQANNVPYRWAYDPNEVWGESGGAALAGAWTKPEKTYNFGIEGDPLAMRAAFRQLMYQARPDLKEFYVAKFISSDLVFQMDANGNGTFVTPIPASAGFVAGTPAACDSQRIGIAGTEPFAPVIMREIKEDPTKAPTADGRFFVRSFVRGDSQRPGPAYFRVTAWQ